MGIIERIKEIEFEMSRTQKNKATNYHLGTLKAKIAKLRTQLMDGPKTGGAQKGEGFDVEKVGDARVALIGFPSVGKSTLLSTVTKTESVAASYEFTTLTCIPGVIEYNDAKIQLLDLPGIIEGAAKGKGRGRQVIGVARSSDLVLMLLDAEKAERQKELLQKELESVGIRLNRRKPNISIRMKKTGGVLLNAMCDLTELDQECVKRICQEYKIHNADVLIREDCSLDELIDVIEGNRVYIRCLYCINKIDNISLREMDRLSRAPDTLMISIHAKFNMDVFLDKIWEYLNFIRLYTKPRGSRPELKDPLIRPVGATVESVCAGVHREMIKKFKFAYVWGVSAKHQPQRVGISHVLGDEDVIQLMTK